MRRTILTMAATITLSAAGCLAEADATFATECCQLVEGDMLLCDGECGQAFETPTIELPTVELEPCPSGGCQAPTPRIELQHLVTASPEGRQGLCPDTTVDSYGILRCFDGFEPWPDGETPGFDCCYRPCNKDVPDYFVEP